MSESKESKIVSIVNPVCCGLDVHKESISACLLYTDAEGKEQTEIKDFDTFTDDLMIFRDWILSNECTIVAMESTGVYWRPIHNILEEDVEVILVNARDIKHVPGRKTDISDSKWLAGLLRYGLLKGSFIPPKEVREWRDLARLRKKQVQTLSDNKRRVHKLFESANIKIDSVVTDLFGVTGRNLINLLLSNHNRITLSDIKKCTHGTLKRKVEELYRSIKGFFMCNHSFMLNSLLRTIEMLEKEICIIDRRLHELMRGHDELLERLKEVPGISKISSREILAEIGDTLEKFGTDSMLVSWCGLCPGNNESAGKRKSGKNPVRKHHLKTVMIEVAWGAVKKKGSYYKDKYHRLKSRRGSRKAIVAIANRIMKGIFHIIKDGVRFRDLGEDFLASRNKARKINRLMKQAESLGFKLVTQKS